MKFIISLFLAACVNSGIYAQCDLEETQKLLASDGAGLAVFGRSVALGNNRIIVGADGGIVRSHQWSILQK